MRKYDLTNKRFGRLLVIKEGITKNKRRRWVCKCDCGNELDTLQSSLIKGATISCGCRKKELGSNNPNWNGYKEITGSQFANMKNNARHRNMPFDLKIEDIWNLFLQQKRKCALSNMDLFFSTSYNRPLKFSKRQDTNASLDRINSNLGYTIDNVQWIHKDVNLMKNQFDEQYFIDICSKVVEHSKI